MDVYAQIRDFAVALEDYLNGGQNPLLAQKVEIITGKKFAKIAVGYVSNEGRSVYCFIDLSNGDILKAAGWKSPAKGKRGSIFNEGYDIGDGKPCDRYGGGMYKR